MPRSGTTLLEQVLSSHSKIASYGETLIFPKTIKKFFPNMQQDLFLDQVDRIDQFKFNEVRNYLVDRYNLNNRQKDFQYYIDKLPFNFIFINFINFFLPESKIIHMNRSPKDICLSIFNNYFTGNFLNFTNSQNDISSYYSQYMTLMECHKEKNLKFIDLKYEDFVKNISAESKRVINYLDLNYEEQQEQYYKSKNIATTLSLGQVRSKNYTTSINRWENYSPFLSESIKNI